MNIDVFVSHHTQSSLHIVEGIVNKLEAIGVRCWYAPRDTEGAYASSIAKAINSCSIFLLILNRPASESFHVLNEIDMVTKRLVKSEDVKILPFHIADDEIGEDAQYYLGRIHWIDAMTPPMYERIDELTEHISRLLGKENVQSVMKEKQQPVYRLIDKFPQVRDIFDGRDHLMEQIHEVFASGKNVLFLEGIGGIGKSELAKQFALKYKNEFEHILFVTYETTLEKMFNDTNAIAIDSLEAGKEESEADFFARKLQILQKITDEKTLIIVDNFDVDSDEHLKEFLTGSYKVIFTTRNAHPGYHTIKVGNIENIEVLQKIFERNYGSSIDEEEIPLLKELFEHIEYHTYTIELIAKQMEASFLGLGEMLELLKKGQLQSAISETIEGRNDRKTAFYHICSVFNTSSLDVEEKKILMYLSLMGHEGVLAVRFKEWALLDSFEIVNRLIRKSWIRKDGQKISLHPLVKEVVIAMLHPDEENCYEFLYEIAKFSYGAWGRKYQDNVAVTTNLLSMLKYFDVPSGKYMEIFEPVCGILWQIGKFDDAIRLGHKLYDACLKVHGEASMITGFVAKSLGGCYFNSRRLLESIPYYQKGLEHMLLSGAEESEDLALAYEKVARCYTWEFNQNFEKSEELFQKSLEIRIRLRDAMASGADKRLILPIAIYDLSRAEERIGENHMEMGRMYQEKGDYEKGLEYAFLQKEAVRIHNPKNVSGLAYGYGDMGVCYYQIGKQKLAEGDREAAVDCWGKAIENLEKALEINMKMRGALAIDTIDNQEVLGDVYAALNRYADASNCYMAVITMIENLLGTDSPRIAEVKRKMEFSSDKK